jgi:hypothetical protein
MLAVARCTGRRQNAIFQLRAQSRVGDAPLFLAVKDPTWPIEKW